ncbi:MAG: hypothetical protein IJ471_00240 [Eubacterium sp.]|nr:hypothetical protein [Eubacterium sp.]
MKRNKREKTMYHKPAQASGWNGKSILIAAIVTAVILALIYYFGLFAINLHSQGFWGVIILGCFLFFGVKSIAYWAFSMTKGISATEVEYQNHKNMKMFYVPFAIIGIVIVISIAGATIFNAGRYASIMTVEEGVFEEDLAETLSTDSIALMDTYSAQMLGDREIGSLSNVVSQYNVSDSYTQIDKNGAPLKVAALDYAGFFKWINNKSEGVPGYVTVSPVNMSAEYVTSEKGMIYVPSAYLAQDLYRHIRFGYPTAIFGNVHFEIDEEGNPYYIATVYKKTIALFNGQTVKGAIIVDPTDGSMEYYDVADIPQWADVIFPGDLLCTQYDWYGKLSNGFINSVIGKKGCKQVTQYLGDEESASAYDAVPLNDYGYIVMGGDVWIYTGVTSVNGDSSNIGFLLANERTGETHYYPVAGADEKSAMAAAEGEVQEKGYQASFPSLINVDGQPTYIMVLKDASGLVKLYAAVNVEQYNLVTTATTQAECIQKYRTLIGTGGLEDGTGSDGSQNIDQNAGQNGNQNAGQSGVSTQEPIVATDSKTITISDIKYIDIDGNTYVYLIDGEQNIYRQKVADNDALLFLQVGENLNIAYNGKELVSFEVVPEVAD